jgi:hypothetical protein
MRYLAPTSPVEAPRRGIAGGLCTVGSSAMVEHVREDSIIRRDVAVAYVGSALVIGSMVSGLDEFAVLYDGTRDNLPISIEISSRGRCPLDEELERVREIMATGSGLDVG